MGDFFRGQTQAGFESPHVAVFVGGVVPQPIFLVPFLVQASPVQQRFGELDLFFWRRQNVSHDQTIELTIRKVVGEVQCEVLLE